MKRKTLLNCLLIVLLLGLLGAVWAFNQKLNYRKILTLNTKLTLNSNTAPLSELSSVTYFINLFKTAGLQVVLLPNVANSPDFAVLGRTLLVEGNEVAIYEYASNKYAVKDYAKNYPVYGPSEYVYKNLVIVNKFENPHVTKVITELQVEVAS